ncbi:bifunctional tRNA (5-methylaminomethyl-2-thiouridine)(34)-methyltransferase MnmD/FAD-dependent 5-carboxymethylaminomethyl-2-thiouridine(34) oxidoreductase MnmC [Marinicella sediminis]|uniref:tRNA 5-methylaminomethyl-2-thiouridine biosynthesis bifunctional protein MnmC n=1 Tax=Marinicella sediminis TaxID=1792834 RepID=A0ABV7J8M7_9GAMM|nr:bifunctional tRNA (5-methylaminomethyl-2-thiouridine)(34)-methyltransferase MnmD/FAD-dependent 5-carboxymethylaminomethyl-2-thiouridine(34) oxidoreductase MnmC [Marinicella sediminis]
MHPLTLAYQSTAKIDRQNGRPYSAQFDDIYFNPEDGLAETRYVFIGGNQLESRWQSHPGKTFCVAETGFGSGLNFLATCLAWQQAQFKPASLCFISTELHPMSTEDLRQTHQLFPELQELSQLLLQQYPSARAGFHQLQITPDISLLLLIGDATACLQQLNGQVNAWFLDGFSPGNNPDLWSADLFEVIAGLSTDQTTLATYTAAGKVRRGLQAAGFAVTKKPGFGQKREMICARYDAAKQVRISNKQPWHPYPKSPAKEASVTILGGGIAGLNLARTFHRTGHHTTIIDAFNKPLQAASGNPAAMMMPVLTARTSPEALFYLRAFEYARRIYGACFINSGITEYAGSDRAGQRRLEQLAESGLPDELLRCSKNQLHYPTAGWVDTNALRQRWLTCVDDWQCHEITDIEGADGQWYLLANGRQVHHCTTLIIAGGMNSRKLSPQPLPLMARLGQTNHLITPQATSIDQVLLNQGYLIPLPGEPAGHHYLLGATFDHVDSESQYHHQPVCNSHQQRNLAHWQEHPEFAKLAQASSLADHTAIRATTPDHLPVCGPLIDHLRFTRDYADLHHGRHWQVYPPAQPLPGLYVLTGLGSRGYTSAPLLADYLHAMISGQPLPLEADLCKIIHPNRFNHRQLKKPS